MQLLSFIDCQLYYSEKSILMLDLRCQPRSPGVSCGLNCGFKIIQYESYQAISNHFQADGYTLSLYIPVTKKQIRNSGDEKLRFIE